jgi:hypothetical protein
MKKITLFVGDCDASIAHVATQFDCNAKLINSSNYKNFFNCQDKITGYTSLSDLPKDLTIFYRLLTVADSIWYCPPQSWSDGKSIDRNDLTSSIQGLTELFLIAINKLKNNVCGLDFSEYCVDKFLKLEDLRKTEKKQMWVAGCSTTAGVGVDEHARYGYLLSKFLNLPVSFLAKASTSISWAADQILRSDIRLGDLVIWGLTNENRLTLWNNSQSTLAHINSNTQVDYARLDLSSDVINKLLIHKTNMFVAIQKIHEVVNFCNKSGAKILIINIHSSNTLNAYLSNMKEFCFYLRPEFEIVDLGTDGLHPGIEQHKLYAEFCIQFLTNFKDIITESPTSEQL